MPDDRSTILEIEIEGIKPIKRGGITAYPAHALPQILAWMDSQGIRVVGMEGVFYNSETDEGQLSLDYIVDWPEGADYAGFRETCPRLASEIQGAGKNGMSGYFEIIVDNSFTGCNRRS